MIPCRVILLGVTFIVSSCVLIATEPEPKLAERIVGRWQGEGTHTIKTSPKVETDEVFKYKVLVEFRTDGTFTFTKGDNPELKKRFPNAAKESDVTGKYSFVKDTEIELTREEDGKKVTSRAKVAITKETLTLTLVVDGKDSAPQETFKRAKD